LKNVDCRGLTPESWACIDRGVNNGKRQMAADLRFALVGSPSPENTLPSKRFAVFLTMLPGRRWRRCQDFAPAEVEGKDTAPAQHHPCAPHVQNLLIVEKQGYACRNSAGTSVFCVSSRLMARATSAATRGNDALVLMARSQKRSSNESDDEKAPNRNP
jgi:hypothetical protein